MPSFEGDTLSRNHFYTAQADGLPMVVKFFSSSCGRCRQTLTALQHVYADDSNLVVVGVTEDESASTARQFVDELGLRFPVIVDTEGRLLRQYQVTSIPATFVITPNGNVSWVGGADQTEEGLRAAVRMARD